MREMAGLQDRSRPYEEIHAVPVRRRGRWVTIAVILTLSAMVVHTLIVNPGFQWGVVAQYFLSPLVLSGIKITLLLTVIAMAIGVALGTVLAIMRLSPNSIVAGASNLYITFFRGTPVLVQVILWYNLAALYSHLSFGIPFGPAFLSLPTNELISPLTAGILALGLNEAAYMAEIVRGGILSLPQGQTAAAMALGMSRIVMTRRVILPQAMKAIIPPTGNECIGMLKWTSIVSVIALSDLLFSVELIYARNYRTIPLLLVACLWYLIMTTVLSIGQRYLERHFARGAVNRSEPSVSVGMRLYAAIVRIRCVWRHGV